MLAFMNLKKRREEAGSAAYEKLVWMTGLPLHCTDKNLEKQYNTGRMIIADINFYNRSCMSSFAKSCVLLFTSKLAAQEFLGKEHKILGAKVEVEAFKGYEYYEEHYPKGIYKMLLSGMDDEINDVEICKMVEAAVRNFQCTNLDLRKRHTQDGSGWVKSVMARFMTKEDREAAKMYVSTNEKEWVCSIEISKKEARKIEAEERRLDESRAKLEQLTI